MGLNNLNLSSMDCFCVGWAATGVLIDVTLEVEIMFHVTRCHMYTSFCCITYLVAEPVLDGVLGISEPVEEMMPLPVTHTHTHDSIEKGNQTKEIKSKRNKLSSRVCISHQCCTGWGWLIENWQQKWPCWRGASTGEILFVVTDKRAEFNTRLYRNSNRLWP